MNNKALQFWNGLPTWAKGTLAVGGVAIGYFTVRSFIKKIRKDADMQKSRSAVKSAKDELSYILKNGGKLTYSNAQYETFAQKLESAFDGWGTVNNQVASVFYELRTKADVLKLIEVFGVRTIDSGKWNGFEDDFTGDLAAVLANEMSQWEITQINGYLSDNNIDYKF